MLPETQKTWSSICSYWIKIIQTNGENGTHIWPPFGSPYYQIRHFLQDTSAHQKVLNGVRLRMIIVDGYEQDGISFDDLEKQIGQSLGFGKADEFSLEHYLSETHAEILVLFLIGFDTLLKRNKLLPLQQISTLSLKAANPNFKLLLITEYNILDSEAFQSLLQYGNLLQNIAYQTLLSEQDIRQFIYFIATQWNIVLPETYYKCILEEVGGHQLLVKEVIRIYRDDRKVAVEQVLMNSTLVRKGIAVFERLSDADKQTVKDILTGNSPMEISEYLRETHVVHNMKLGIPYWYRIKEKFISSSLAKNSPVHSIDYYLTPAERDIFETLIDSKQILTKDQVAEKIWHANWEDKYSDWAIDQLMHRLREKLLLTKSPYEIRTKKGQGYFVVTK